MNEITLNGRTYKVGDVLHNYTEAGPLMDVWNKTQKINRPLWFRASNGAEYDWDIIEPYHWPVIVLALPPTPKPIPVEDWLAWLKAGKSLHFFDPVISEFHQFSMIKSYSDYCLFTCLASNGVKFYASEVDCKAAEGVE